MIYVWIVLIVVAFFVIDGIIEHFSTGHDSSGQKTAIWIVLILAGLIVWFARSLGYI